MLDHVQWTGGGTGAGKTTIVHRVADESRLVVYITDTAIRVHAARLDACAAPLLESFRRMSMDERWVLPGAAEMYRTFPWFHGEGFDLLVEDLRSLPGNRRCSRRGVSAAARLRAPASVRPESCGEAHPDPGVPTGGVCRARSVGGVLDAHNRPRASHGHWVAICWRSSVLPAVGGRRAAERKGSPQRPERKIKCHTWAVSGSFMATEDS